jgi:hypothetical protein
MGRPSSRTGRRRPQLCVGLHEQAHRQALCQVLSWGTSASRYVSVHVILRVCAGSFLGRVVVVDHVRGCLEAAHGRIEWLLELEDMPFTLNTHYLADYTEKFRRYYKSVYESNQESDVLIDLHNYKPSENDKETQDMVDQALDSLRDLGIHTTVPSLAKLLPPTPDEHALQVMAEVRAYYQGLSYNLLSLRTPDSLWCRVAHSRLQTLHRYRASRRGSHDSTRSRQRHPSSALRWSRSRRTEWASNVCRASPGAEHSCRPSYRPSNPARSPF